MIYFYDVKLLFYRNNEHYIKSYVVSYLDLPNFLYMKKQKNSSMEIYSIKGRFSLNRRFM